MTPHLSYILPKCLIYCPIVLYAQLSYILPKCLIYCPNVLYIAQLSYILPNCLIYCPIVLYIAQLSYILPSCLIYCPMSYILPIRGHLGLILTLIYKCLKCIVMRSQINYLQMQQVMLSFIMSLFVKLNNRR